MAKKIKDFSKLCIHTITNKPWSLEEAVLNYAKAGVKGITVWQDALDGRDIKKSGKLIRDHDMSVISYCRGGFFPHKEKSGRNKAIDENLSMLNEAAELGAPLLVLVCGSSPDQSLFDSREQIKDGIAAILPTAEKNGIKLAIEPLHPMYADTRSAVNTLEQANDMAEFFNSPWVGVAVDVYHLWWDSNLEQEIKRCGKNNNLLAFHICDWKVPTKDILLDRGIMGEGCINISQIREWVENTGFNGYNEVEIFSTEYWGMDQEEYLEKILKAYLEKS